MRKPANVFVDLKAVEEEILAGLPNETERRDDALYNLEYYHGDFSRFPVRDPGQNSDGNRFPRNSLFMQRVVNTACSLVYRKGPKRELPEHKEAEEWLEDCYTRNNADALFAHALRLTFVSDVSAVQAETSGDPACPVKLRVWESNSFVVWVSPDDPCQADAVATIDVYDGRRRLRLWTPDEVREYQTQKWDTNTRTAGATAYTFVRSFRNTLGIVPFAFFHYDLPVLSFWTPGPGCYLRETNDWINKRLSDTFDACRFNLNPVVLLKNTQIGWRPSAPIRPGDVWNLPPDRDIVHDGAAEPDASYLQADSSFIAAGWDDLNFAIDHSLEMVGIQPSQIRMVQDSARSGASIAAEQIEPVKFAEGRQALCGVFEDRLAKVVLTVAAAHLGTQEVEEYTVTSAQLQKAADDPGLTLRWPSLYPKLPGTETDQGDQWLLDNGLTSRTKTVQERWGFTEQEAVDYLQSVADDLTKEHALFATPDMAQAKVEADQAKLMAEAQGKPVGASDGQT